MIIGSSKPPDLQGPSPSPSPPVADEPWLIEEGVRELVGICGGVAAFQGDLEPARVVVVPVSASCTVEDGHAVAGEEAEQVGFRA